MLEKDTNWWKPRTFRRTWHEGHAARLARMPCQNPYYGLADFFAWSNGYMAAHRECLDAHEHMMKYDSEYRDHFEFMTMRAYWQGLHWDTEGFTDDNKNPYLDAEEPNQALIDAWNQGRHDAKA